MNDASTKCYGIDGNSDILSRIPTGHARILDVGCGAGGNAKQLQIKGHQVVGVTLSDSEARKAEEFCEAVYIQNLEQGLPLLSGHFDYVVCSHVLEHICWPENLFTDILKMLSPNGRVLVALPNMLFISNRIKILAGRFHYEEGGLMDNTHFRIYTFQSAQELFRKNGYIVEEAAVTGHVPLPMLRGMLKGRRLFFENWMVNSMPGLFGYQMIYSLKAAGNTFQEIHPYNNQ